MGDGLKDKRVDGWLGGGNMELPISSLLHFTESLHTKRVNKFIGTFAVNEPSAYLVDSSMSHRALI